MVKYFLIAILVLASQCDAEVRLPKIIGSGMVLQRNTEVKIWGWANAGEKIEIQCDWLDQKQTATTGADGSWQIKLKTGKAGGPHSITLTGENTIELDNILFGEVWLASGQSNMEMPLAKVSNAYTGINDAAGEIQKGNHPHIRFFQVGNFSSKEPLDDVEPGIEMYGIPTTDREWHTCTPEIVVNFSATAYFFARHLNEELGVPIGIVDASWGGTSAEVWTPAGGLEKLGYDRELEQANTLPQNANQKIPSRLYNGMIHPLRRMTITGVIWYQGEGNARRADKYKELFTTMIEQWRSVWNQDFPFYFVQIAPYNYSEVNSAFLREAQLETLDLAKTGMVVTLDIGNPKDIHPKNKQEVGRRLALWALAKDYHKDVACSGPLYRKSIVEGEKIRIRFDHAEAGLYTSDNQAPNFFEIAGSDSMYHPAIATIDGADIVVSSKEVAAPKKVRFAFSNLATPNLVNKAGLPASSFRTEK